MLVLRGLSGCELLSNHYLCANKNSANGGDYLPRVVVNCFQIIIFVLTRTAEEHYPLVEVSCELLSNHYLCANKNSKWLKLSQWSTVVNCFQIIIFVLTRTAEMQPRV